MNSTITTIVLGIASLSCIGGSLYLFTTQKEGGGVLMLVGVVLLFFLCAFNDK